jgi:hypothetical protein
MQSTSARVRAIVSAAALALLAFWNMGGCGSLSTNGLNLLNAPPLRFFGPGDATTDPPANDDGSFFDNDGRGSSDPCTLSLDRKFVRISMRNLGSGDFVHYFAVFIAFVQSETYPDGAVCPDDRDLYTSFGYTEVADGQSTPFGNFCIDGPALVYFHQAGQFRRGGGTGNASLGSAIGPAQGSNATFDNFFTSSGAQVPVPDLILFHNPGSGAGAPLLVDPVNPAPCSGVVITNATPECQMDAFYYVDERDRMAGSTALGSGSGRRVPSEIQGTSCECAAFGQFTPIAQSLAPANASGSQVRCNEYVRGGRIEYAFLREDTNPPTPQLVWRVLDTSGGTVQDFDSRVDVP